MGKKNLIYLLILTVVIGIFPFCGGNVYYLSVMIIAGLYAMGALGLCLLTGYAGQISLCPHAFFGIGAYTSGIISTRLGVSPWIGILMGSVVSSVFAVLISVPSLKLEGFYLGLATLAFAEIIIVALNEFRTLTGGPSGISGIPRLSILGFTFDSDFKYYFLVWAVVIFFLVVSLNIIQSRVGRALRTLGESERGAMAMGVNVPRLKVQIFVLSSVFTSVGGSFYSHYVTFVSPEAFGILLSILLITIIAIGGIANIWGAIIGAIILVFLSEYLRIFQEYYLLIYGATLGLIMIFFPKGFFEELPNLRRLLGRRKIKSKNLNDFSNKKPIAG